METFITALTANKLVFTAAVIISILIVLSAIRKLIKLALVLLALLVLYSAYVVYTGRKPAVIKVERCVETRMAGMRDSGNPPGRGVVTAPGVTPLPRARI
jgi:hypothetical protein